MSLLMPLPTQQSSASQQGGAPSSGVADPRGGPTSGVSATSGPRARWASRSDGGDEAAALAAEEDSSKDGVLEQPLFVWPLPLRPYALLGVIGFWVSAVVSVGIVVQLNRVSPDGHRTPIWMPLTPTAQVATAFLLSLLMVPWAFLWWRQLRPLWMPWCWLDAFVTGAIFVATLTCAVCLLLSREQPTSGYLLAASTVCGLAALSTATLLAVRVSIVFAGSVAGRSAWKWEPAVARSTVLLLSVAALCTGFSSPAVKRVEIHVAGLPAAADGYALCMLSDLHAGPTTGPGVLQEIVAHMRPLGCQAVVLNGDIAEGTVQERALEMEELLPLAAMAPDGAYYVPGNHEFYNFAAPGGSLHAAAEWTKWWAAHGIQSLNNTQVRIPLSSRPGVQPGTWFVLAGVDDIAGAPDLDAALNSGAGAKGSAALPSVLMAHRPAPTARKAAERGVAAQFSGHTHGGQLWPLHVAVYHANEGYVSGLYKVGAASLYVSDGTVGTYITRLRLFSQAEITHIVLRSRPCPSTARWWSRPAVIGLILDIAFVFLCLFGVLIIFYRRTRSLLVNQPSSNGHTPCRTSCHCDIP